MPHSTPNIIRIPLPILMVIIERDHTVPVLLLNEQEQLISANLCFKRAAGIPLDSEESIKGKPLSAFIRTRLPLAALYEQYLQSIQFPTRLPVLEIETQSGPVKTGDYVLLAVDVDGEAMWVLALSEHIAADGFSLLRLFMGTLMSDINLGVMLINNDFRLLEISDMACRVLGLEQSAVIGQSMEDVFAEVPEQHRLVQRTILDGVVIRNHAVSWTNNQERFELLMDSNLLKDSLGTTVGAYIIFKDVTNLRSLEQQVQRSDRLAMIGQIAAGTAHEIRNPLTSIKGFMQVLKTTFIEKGMTKEESYTDIMLTEIDRINELVSEFLLLSKQKDVHLDSVDVSTVLRDMLPILNNEAILHNVIIRYNKAKALPKVVADREMLKQVFLNIGKNGIEAMVGGGTLTITERYEDDEQRVNIDIHDNGPGIPAFLVDKIFDPFFTTKDEGTGLGLSICQRIIHDIGGNIRVSSKGYGTTFTVSIPYPASSRI
ncbi:ATP-binding protein [Paenibacillus sp. y28]|uniref:ATP-binding protein n=1 Tax=Paenibacillus sp. y28 TaxID=3129110 RepID=UPI003019115E